MRAIPKKRNDVISLATQALAGAATYGATVGLLQNTSERIAADLYDLTGPPGTEPMGKQGQLNERRDVLHAARVSRRAVIAEARTFAANAVDLLKRHLGRGWNPRWQVA